MSYMYNGNSMSDNEAIGCLGFLALMFSAYVTHVIWVIHTLSSNDATVIGQIALAVIGAIFFPVGIIHGFYLWFMPW